MPLTESEKTELKKDILNSIKSESQSVDELPEVTSLDNIKSLPALRGTDVVSAPIALLRKPAEDAAATAATAAKNANTAAGAATQAAGAANTAAGTAEEKAAAAQTAANNANAAVTDAMIVKNNYEGTALAALKGATARFEGIVESGTMQMLSSVLAGGRIVWLRSAKKFAYEVGGKYYNNWSVEGVPVATLYHDAGVLLKDKVYVMGSSFYVWSEEEGDLVEISGSGGGNILNVTEAYPLASGYHTLATAIAAVEAKLRGKGRCVTYEVSQGKWETKQFTGTSVDSWDTAASWEDFGGAGTLKSLTVNGEKKTPDGEGNVSLTIEQVEVDESLDAASTNPVENRAVAAKLSELDANTIFGGSAELSDDETSVRLTLTNKSGAEVMALDIPAGSGGGGEGSTTKIVLGASVDHPTVKEGGAVKLTWTYDHQYSSGDEKGESTGQKATVTVQIRRGTTLTYSDTTQDVNLHARPDKVPAGGHERHLRDSGDDGPDDREDAAEAGLREREERDAEPGEQLQHSHRAERRRLREPGERLDSLRGERHGHEDGDAVCGRRPAAGPDRDAQRHDERQLQHPHVRPVRGPPHGAAGGRDGRRGRPDAEEREHPHRPAEGGEQRPVRGSDGDAPGRAHSHWYGAPDPDA